MPTPQEAEIIVHAWLKELAQSASTHDLPAHMQLVSRKVKVVGLPSGKNIDYDGWRIRRFNEFNGKLLQSLNYQLREIVNTKDDQIVFSVHETMYASNGTTIVADKDVILQKEKDNRWRVRYERYDKIKVH